MASTHGSEKTPCTGGSERGWGVQGVLGGRDTWLVHGLLGNTDRHKVQEQEMR